MTSIIQFDQVSKCFAQPIDRPRTFQERFVGILKRRPRQADEKYWVLRDVSFDIEPGETVGLIGSNGAGKSTALKIMARTLMPTSGRVKMNGRVAALLELGVGFHPDLTGRENVFLSGSIMGLSRAHVKRSLEEIVAFAELERFIDVPVKHYSSGMYVRLGFAVAVHADPDILLIDEVLAVGDAHFQQKCLKRIKQLHQHGVTIVQVSHSMPQIEDTCKRVFWIDDGVLCSAGDARQVIADYLSAVARDEYAQAASAPGSSTGAASNLEEPSGQAIVTETYQRWGDRQVVIEAVQLRDAANQTATSLRPNEALRIEITYRMQAPLEEPPTFGIAFYRSDGVWCYGTNTTLDGVRFAADELPQAGTIVAELPVLQLLQGEYSVDVAAHNAAGNVTYDYIRARARFSVVNDRADQGVFRPQVRWQLAPAGEKEHYG